jgi:beta-lactamase regulating signal transducer with metallopeptidase domain
VIGWLRPVILLPVSVLAGLTPQMMEAILAHELAHIRRHDYLLNMLQTAIETLLFYHPAVWWVGRKIRQERENCCDDLAVTACGDALIYARALTALSRSAAHRRSSPWPPPMVLSTRESGACWG